ncbi:MAG: phospho-N-acetylmuramoyl-pentapeptide-transferase [Candidatus Peribacteraceae bacterium]|nr:phospho-N-acetylmuramoyl-pentapeptide-transferase [Candidatus Peribacteraceae bacterium]
MDPLIRPDVPLAVILVYAVMAFSLVLAFTPWFVNFLRFNKLGKELRVETLDGREASVFRQYHSTKWGTPTMGGIIIWLGVVVTILLSRFFSYIGVTDYSLLQRREVYLPLFTMIAMGILGAIDDYLNVRGVGKTKGLAWLPKLLSMLFIASAGAWWFYTKLEISSISIPFYGSVELGLWYIPLFILVMTSTANAVNFTDGLDGLAGGLLVICFSAFAVLAYMSGLTVLCAFCAVTAGAITAFLWHNVPPAMFFMGDTGSMALGGTLGVIALMTDDVLLLPLIGIVFLIELLSVVIQLTSKKLRNGKKVFIAAPIHHHFEALQWGESKVTMRLWIIGGFGALLGVIIGLSSASVLV